jgi:hypothetical protein
LPAGGTGPKLERMRFLVLSVFLLAGAPLVRAANVEFIRVWPAWREAESFDRIKEYFGGKETYARQTVLRTQPETRDGYYFLVRVKTDAVLPEARFELSVIRPDQPEPQTFVFRAGVAAKESVFQLGVTGADWPGGKEANPVAWRLALVGPADRVLAEEKSFLWEKPAK